MTTLEKSVLSPDEVSSLMSTANPRAVTGCRDRALIALLHGAGLRLFEALALEPKDVDLPGGRITVHHGKGDKRRVVGLLPDMEEPILAWFRRRARLALPAGSPLFCSLTRGCAGNPMSQSQVRDMLKRRAAKAGIEKRVHPHGLRHSHAAELDSQGVPLSSIRAQLGHSRATTTDIYLSRLTNRGAVDAVRAIRSKTQAGPYTIFDCPDGHGIYSTEIKRPLCFGGNWAWRRLSDLERDMTPEDLKSHWAIVSEIWPA